MDPRASIVVALPVDEHLALDVLGALAGLPQSPAHDVVLVDRSAGALDGLLARVAGDVRVVVCPESRGPVGALAAAVPVLEREVVAVLDEHARPAGDWLSPLLAALDRPATAAATSVTRGATPGIRAFAVRRTDLEPALGASGGLTEMALALAARGAVRPVPASVVTLATDARPEALVAPGCPLELSVVVPTLDAGAPRVRRLLAALERTLDVAYEVILQHNGSPPQGFSAPVNAGLRAARAPYLVVMNDDVEVLEGWWPPLRAALDAGAQVTFPRTVEGFDRHDFAAWCFATTRDAVDRHAVAPGEFFDPELVVHFQDTDLYVRLARAGTPPVRVEAARVRHGLSETLESDDPTLRRWVGEQVVRDRAAFARKHPEAHAGMRVIRTR